MVKFHHSNIKRAIKHLFLRPNPKLVVLDPHMGLGDNLVCIGLVRTLAERNPDVTYHYACPYSSYHTLSWCFKELKNVFLVPIAYKRQAIQLAGFLNATHAYIGTVNHDITKFDQSFYDQHHVPFEDRWEKAQVDPGPQSHKLFQLLNPNNQPYILVCNVYSEGRKFTLNVPNPNSKLIIEVAPLTNNLFDWAELIIRADEIHSVGTAFLHLLEGMLYGKPQNNLYRHHVRQFLHTDVIDLTEYSSRLHWNEIRYVSS